MKRMRFLLPAGMFLLLMALNGCITLFPKKAAPRVYVHDAFPETKIRDIGVLPFVNHSNSKKDISNAVTSQFVTELNKKGWYVLHPLTEEDLLSPEKVEHIDGLIRGDIQEYKDMDPLRFGIQLTLTDLETQETLWSVQKVYDAAQQDVVESVKAYYDSHVKDQHPVMGYRIYLLAMNRFLEFVFSDITDTLK